MRELKFRAWNARKKKMRYGAEHAYDCGAYYDVDIDTSCFGELLDDEDYTIEQYTGLKYKNGKEIYEGDIVKTNSPDQPNFKVGVIEFVQQAFWISNVPSNRPDHTHSELLLQYWETEIEVIGNIHENPELLGGEE